jgi:hypothetical protein
MISLLEQRIYNTFLAISRKKQNKPFKLRKDFEDFEQDPKYTPVKKLAYFFERFENIDVNDFFLAPYAIYENDENAFYDMEFYLTQKARHVYSLYMKKKDNVEVDSEENIEKCKESLLFIYKYCKEKNIPVTEYLDVVTEGNVLPDFAKHLKNRNVNIYTLFAFPDFENKFFKISADLLDFMFGSLYNDFVQFRRKFIMSNKCKEVCRTGLEILKNKL